MLKETEQMIDAAKHDWWENEVGKLNTVSQADKWKINWITNPDKQMGTQPVKADEKYVFSDEEILQEMEKFHVCRDDVSSLVRKGWTNS